jgi:hypothetical protein
MNRLFHVNSIASGAVTSGNVTGIPAAVVSLEDAAAAILSSSDPDG